MVTESDWLVDTPSHAMAGCQTSHVGILRVMLGECDRLLDILDSLTDAFHLRVKVSLRLLRCLSYRRIRLLHSSARVSRHRRVGLMVLVLGHYHSCQRLVDQRPTPLRECHARMRGLHGLNLATVC